MNIHKTLRPILIAVALTLAGTVSARAATISFSDPAVHSASFLGAFFDQIVPAGSDSSGRVTGSYTLQRFDSSLGTLNSVILNVTQTVRTQFEDIGGTCAGPDPTCAVNMTQAAAQNAWFSVGSEVGVPFLTGASGSHPSTCDIGGSCIGFVDSHDFVYNTTISVFPGVLLFEFVGPGNFAVGTAMVTSLDASIVGTQTLAGSVISSYEWSGTATVTYDYTPGAVALPAPGGAAFLLIACAGIARRKRRA